MGREQRPGSQITSPLPRQTRHNPEFPTKPGKVEGKSRKCRWELGTLACSLCPPERNMIPGTAAGIVRLNVRSVAVATSSGVAFCVDSAPGRIIWGCERTEERGWFERGKYAAGKVVGTQAKRLLREAFCVGVDVN